jgi:NitT/TauT family transport system permease protein
MNRSGKWASPLFFVFLALIWEGVARMGMVSPRYFPPISKIASTFLSLCERGTMPVEVLNTFERMACGFFLATVSMVPLGVVMGLYPVARNLLLPTVEFFRPLPPPAIIPAVMMFLGIGFVSKAFVIFFACSFPILLNTIDGVRSVNPLFIQTGRSFGLGGFELMRKVILPASLPQIMSGLRISLPIALIVAILSEMVGSVDGIGHFILRMERTFNIPEMYAGTFMLGIIGYGLNKIFLHFDRTILAWHLGWKAGRRV